MSPLAPDSPDPVQAGLESVDNAPSSPLSLDSALAAAAALDIITRQAAQMCNVSLDQSHQATSDDEKKDRATLNQDQSQLDADDDVDFNLDLSSPPSPTPSDLADQYGGIYIDQFGYPVNLLRLRVVERPVFRRLTRSTMSWPNDTQLIDLAEEARYKRFKTELHSERHFTDEQRKQRVQRRKEQIQAKLPSEYLSMKTINHGRLLGLMLQRWGMYNFFVEEVENFQWEVSAVGELSEDDKKWCSLPLPENVAAAYGVPTQTAGDPPQRRAPYSTNGCWYHCWWNKD
ncbi:hypothetical protein SMACR_04704 [Sordaria macrospora]|uniref:WGS project CABT00000000 data, contig 2.21 n=2 Tax=Sordaria macrospora TaxID=5147 RepID=F7W272_SORMK|nr:uncharacterized protein SMAC_04704 [Sordaria macrospora k-hell]KAA8632286.1 hypothetical protein SMACR_04704 [Sordaria macrospora]WPJ61977.1 hypothetical protein SMAC4_04704 [Sordaria macrospora]CCC11722.1 unnamed protein product [Sordaria macrospora k-hell]